MNVCRNKPSYVKRLTVVLIAVWFLIQLFSLNAFATESGSCGGKLEWSYSSGTLTVTGSGDMTDFTERNMAPWYAFSEEITRVVFPARLTSVGNLAFYGCKNLRTVILPDSVHRIGNMAFAGCENLQILSLGEELNTIGESAFYGCLSLNAVRLPSGLEALGNQAFYCCESLTTVTVPTGLKQMGTAVFAYCKSLVRAEIQAQLKSVPEWTFYGCENLTSLILAETVNTAGGYAFWNCEGLSTVYFAGGEQETESLRQSIAASDPEFEEIGYITSAEPPVSANGWKTVDHQDGTVTQSNTVVREEEHITVVTTVDRTYEPPSITPDGEIVPPEDGKDAYTTNLLVTVDDKEGWDSVQQAIKSALKEVNNTYSDLSEHKKMHLTIQIKDGGFEGEALMQELAGRNMSVTVMMPNGSGWRFNCEELNRYNLPDDYNFSYTLEAASDEICEKLGTEACYQVKFEKSAQMNVEILIPFPGAAQSNAFLYQVERDDSLTLLQTVTVDEDGIAHFYLASVNARTEYIVALNVPEESADHALISDEQLSQYEGGVENIAPVEYVVTGVKSSWGMSFLSVTLIMLGVLIGCIVVVGVVMFSMNKRNQNRKRQQRRTRARRR